MQPGTANPGKSWQSRSPDPDDEDDKLNQALKDSFPASDPPQSAQPGVTGWDVTDRGRAESRSDPQPSCEVDRESRPSGRPFYSSSAARRFGAMSL